MPLPQQPAQVRLQPREPLPLKEAMSPFLATVIIPAQSWKNYGAVFPSKVSYELERCAPLSD